MILVAVVWSGNELVGKKGIEGEGLMNYIQAVHSAAVVSAPDPADYSFATGGTYASWMNQLCSWFQDEVYPSQIGKCRFWAFGSSMSTC